jgi:hypothetical protein
VSAPLGQRPCADVHVRRRTFVGVMTMAVMVRVDGAVRALPRREIDGAHAESDQHQCHQEFERVRESRRQVGAQHHQHDADDEKREGVADSPAGAEQRRLEFAAFARDQRRHRGEMIRFERVAHAEQRAETGTGQHFEDRHDAAPGHSIPLT